MSDANTTPMTPEEQEQFASGCALIEGLMGSVITDFGPNEKGEIYLRTVKDEVVTELIIGKDEDGEITLYEAVREEGELK